ncbi:MAG: hypothetical protein ACO1NO_12950 [Burkholderiaceae bacterium]
MSSDKPPQSMPPSVFPVWAPRDMTIRRIGSTCRGMPDTVCEEVALRYCRRYAVAGSGFGIPGEAPGNVFGMFNQVGRNRDCAQGWLGIGLPLVGRRFGKQRTDRV